jgi:uncharacterized protein
MNRMSVRIIEATPITRCKYCLIGVPDVGLVGSIALSYLIHEQGMTEIGHLESDAVHRGDPKPPCRLYQKDDLIAIISEIPIDPPLIPSTARAVVEWARAKHTELIIPFSGIAVPNRLDLEVPAVYGVGSSDAVKTLLTEVDIPLFEEGFLVGLHSATMTECVKKGVPSLMLLAQAHLRYPDPGAAASLLTSFSKLAGLEVDTAKLLAQEDEIRVRMRELMQRTQQQMRQTQKGREQEIPPMFV